MKKIIIKEEINMPIEKVWSNYTMPKHITKWNNASDDWHTPKAENDLRVGGKFIFRMEAKDKSQGFDFEGKYIEVIPNKKIKYIMADKREVEILFEENNNKTKIKIEFDPEKVNSLEMQREGWQAILTNFKRYAEKN